MKSVFLLVGDYWHSAESIRPIVEFLFNKDEWKVIFTEKPEEIYNLSTKPELVISFKDPIENDQIPTDVWCDDKHTVKSRAEIRYLYRFFLCSCLVHENQTVQFL